MMQGPGVMRENGRKNTRVKSQSNSIWKEENLCGMGLTSLPNPPTFNLACITKLDLSCNNLQSISESVAARLVNVVVLDLHSNQLKTLPNSIGCLSRLKRLDASGNQLHSLPRTIQDCRALEELVANFNELTQLPDTIGQGLTNLRLLSVHSNKLTFLPPTTHKLLSLRTLDAHLNCLLTLPTDLHLLPFLNHIDVSQNFHHLHYLPDSIGLLPSLSHLNISYNNITSLPDSLACATLLSTLHAVSNPLVSPPIEVALQGTGAIREFLITRMNGAPRKHGKAAWLRRLARSITFQGRSHGMGHKEDEDYSSVHILATPYRGKRYTGVLSPLRIFSRQTKISASMVSK